MNKQRGWVITAWVGVIMVLIAILTVAAVTFDKELVKPLFLEFVSGGVMAGGLIVFIAAWFLPDRKTWRGITLMVWGLIAVTSPWFGLLFLVPWAVVAVMLPLVIAILLRQSRIAKTVPVIAVS
jgi:hypothetical protein